MHTNRKKLGLIQLLAIILLLGPGLFSCRSNYTKDELELFYERIKPNLIVLVECVKKFEKASYENSQLRFSLHCINEASDCWINFDRDSSYVDKRESLVFHYDEGKFISRNNIKDIFSSYVKSVITELSVGLGGVDIEILSIYEDDNILIYLNDDQGLFYPLNLSGNFKYRLGCSTKTIERMINNKTINRKPSIVPLEGGWYYITGIFCHGIN